MDNMINDNSIKVFLWDNHLKRPKAVRSKIKCEDDSVIVFEDGQQFTRPRYSISARFF